MRTACIVRTLLERQTSYANFFGACRQTPSRAMRARHSVEWFVLNVVLGRVLVDELVDDAHAFAVRVVDAHERLPLLRERVFGEDRLDRAFRFACPAIDALLGIDHEDAAGFVDAVD